MKQLQSFQNGMAKKIVKGKVTSAEALTLLQMGGVLVISVVLCKMQ